MPELRCRGTNADGSACRAPENLVDPETQLCAGHDPARREMLIEAGKKGGKAAARRMKRAGLEAEELGALESIEDARRWLEKIGHAVAAGQLDHKSASAALKSVEIATKILQTASREEIADLREQLRHVKKMRAVS